MVWHALLGPCRGLGEVREHAGRFDADVSPFAALCDEPDADAWDELRALAGPGARVGLVLPPLAAPDGWEIEHRIPCVQMTADDVVAGATADVELLTLGSADVDEMLALVAQTRPGPFGPRTIEFGTYLGVRDGGRLVAMAGERLHLPGFTEISAVCTIDSHRGRGLGTTLVRALVQHIRARGDAAILHAAATNESAIRLYLALGFVVRRQLEVMLVRAPRGVRARR